MILTLIVAVSDNQVIGRANQLPWHLPRDLAYFKQVTLGCPVIMGRKTYESIGKALPERTNIIITRNHDYQLTDAFVTHTLKKAIEKAQTSPSRSGETHIIGGATLFKEALTFVDKIYLNRIRTTVEGDTYFPEIDPNLWRLSESTHHPADSSNAYAMDFQVLEKN